MSSKNMYNTKTSRKGKKEKADYFCRMPVDDNIRLFLASGESSNYLKENLSVDSE